MLTQSPTNRESQVIAHQHPIDFCVHSVYAEGWQDCHAGRLLLAGSSPDPIPWGSRGAVSSFGFHISSFGFSLKGFAMATLTIFEKLDQLEARYDELTRQISSPEVLADSPRYQKLARQHAELSELVAKHREWKQIEKDLAGARQMHVEADDPEMKQLAHEEEKQLAERKEIVERELKVLLLPKDPNDEKNVIVEIRAGTGGDEAALFAGELFRMYSRYAESQKWRVEVLESSPSSLGGLKEVVAAIQGNKVYSKLKYESGVHRVQRVPATEQQGRIHTSAATVAVLPEADEIDIKIEAKDLRVDTFCSSGPGDRSEKIRTYNYPQNRVTDHRIGLTLHQLTEVMDGKLAPMVDALVSHYEAERLKQELAEA